MKPQKAETPTPESGPVEVDRQLRAPLSWHLRKVWRGARIPIALAVVALGWIYVPQLQARKEQNALATEYFAICRRTLKDTAQLPKVPEEALNEALKKHPLTSSALRTWDPQVWSDIRDKQWIAHIRFAAPGDYSVQEEVGPVLAEAGYDTPSPGQ